MAAQQHSTSRRAVIGALAAAPVFAAAAPVFATAGIVKAAVAGGSPLNAGPDTNPWDLALATYRRLQAEWAAHPYGRTAPGSPDYERLEAEEGVIADRASQALGVVLRTAVPDHAALVEKMEVFEREFGPDLDGHFAHLLADARRLSS